MHTDDGGQRWSPQVSGVKCTLSSVCFVDARNGWAAGGMAYPYLHDSTGVVLATCDGGLSWQREPALLPALRKIRFVSERQGWAIASASAMFPGGTFYYPRRRPKLAAGAPSGGTSRLSAGDFFDGHNAILGGSLGLTAAISDGDFARNPAADTICEASMPCRRFHPGMAGWRATAAGSL